MLGSYGIQPVTVFFNNSKNCFLHLPNNLSAQLSLHENQAVELSWDHGVPVFLSWTRGRSSSTLDDHKVELNRQLGERLGLRDGEHGFLRPCQQVLSVQQVFVEPLSADDWEILELHSAALEQQLLDQIRVVSQGSVFPVWVDQRTLVYIRIGSLSPTVPYGRLEQFTELVVSPKLRTGSAHLPSHPFTSSSANQSQSSSDSPNQNGSSSSPANQNQSLHRQPTYDLPPSPSSSLGRSAPETDPATEQPSLAPQAQQWGGIADLRSFLRYMLTGAYRPAREVPPVPAIPALLGDSVYRVCRSPPGPSCQASVSHDAVHLLPWGRDRRGVEGGGQPAVTYGLLSRVLSPKEVRESTKQAMEKRRSGGGGGGGGVQTSGGAVDGEKEKVEREQVSVVKVVCHHVETLRSKQITSRGGELHCGLAWVPEALACRMNIQLHSTLRIRPVQTCPQVAFSISLQPLKSLPGAEGEEEVQMAFLGWLHTRSHQPLACLTARSSLVLLHGTEGKQEFVLAVVKPEAEREPLDQLFLLASSLMRREDIQVIREPVTMPTVKAVAETPYPDLPSLDVLGGVEEQSRAALEFVSHSLLGSPLSRELVSGGRGLRGGALLITGAKGSGKSSLARAVCRKAAEDLDAHVEVVECRKLKGKRADSVRQVLEEVFEQAVWRQPTVVLLDDLDHVTGAATSPEQDHGPEALLHQHIAQSVRDLVDDMVVRSSLVCVMVTSQSEHSLHPALREVQGSHLLQGHTHIPAPDQAQRAEILGCLIQRKSPQSDTLTSVPLAAIAKETEGYLARDLSLLLERAVHANAVHQGRCSSQGISLSWRDFLVALRDFTPPSLWGAGLQPPSGAGLEKVGGLQDVRQLLMDTVLLPAKFPLLFSRLPVRLRSGVLLYGAPGTGKTLLAGALARDSGMNFICIKGPELLSKYIGASEQAVRDVFQRAQAARPCLLFFDEFDSLAPRRGHDSTGVTDRVVNQLLTQLDGVEGLEGVYVLAASSRPDLIDPALLRPGRLDQSLYCPPPDQPARVEILQALSSCVPLAADVDLDLLASATELFSGADLKALLYNGLLDALHSPAHLAGPAPSVHELGSGSDSDGSLSSMIFLNHSSGSDQSAWEGEPCGAPTGLEAPLEAPLEAQDARELLPDTSRNIWRLYFGSSFESELGNPSPPGLGVSDPSSMTHELPGGLGAGVAAGPPPACMPSLQSGYGECSPEQQQRLLLEVSCIKNNYRTTTEESSILGQAGSCHPPLVLGQANLLSALASTRPSLSRADWKRYSDLYEAFAGTGEGTAPGRPVIKPGQRVSLA
ncbi:LOW QUALITY PROTEIN: peroxisome biogenesis factor 1 [Osmerus eperlanus]|uniref:LOW QUALITY PROTEIN: peroxisome biogenesis factor 1 n=1 Tax=Osmerus eperlanus TaxID=29151 RepID=UPI002E0E2B32